MEPGLAATPILGLAGERCATLTDEGLRNLELVDIQCDEIWTLVGKKLQRLTDSDNREFPVDQYTFFAIDRYSKLVRAPSPARQPWFFDSEIGFHYK